MKRSRVFPVGEISRLGLVDYPGSPARGICTLELRRRIVRQPSAPRDVPAKLVPGARRGDEGGVRPHLEPARNAPVIRAEQLPERRETGGSDVRAPRRVVAEKADGVVAIVRVRRPVRGRTHAEAAPDEDIAVPAEDMVVGDVEPAPLPHVEALHRADAACAPAVVRLLVRVHGRVVERDPARASGIQTLTPAAGARGSPFASLDEAHLA
jgi:hypothetical protein